MALGSLAFKGCSFIKKMIFYHCLGIKMSILVISINFSFGLKLYFFLLVLKEIKTFFWVPEIPWALGTALTEYVGSLSTGHQQLTCVTMCPRVLTPRTLGQCSVTRVWACVAKCQWLNSSALHSLSLFLKISGKYVLICTVRFTKAVCVWDKEALNLLRKHEFCPAPSYACFSPIQLLEWRKGTQKSKVLAGEACHSTRACVLSSQAVFNSLRPHGL